MKVKNAFFLVSICFKRISWCFGGQSNADAPTFEEIVGRSEQIWTPMSNYLNGTNFKDNAMSRVINGIVVQNRRYDYHVQATGGTKACGGILIAENIVLTAAHCKDGFKQVYIGMYKWFQNNDNYKELINVLHEIPHPDFDPKTYDSDLMIVVLERKSKFPPVCISNDDTLLKTDKSVLHVMGFGNTQESGTLSYLLREVDVRYIDNDSCKKEYPQHIISNEMMCCDSSHETKDACQGDSGGPLIVKGDSAKNDVAVGIVSWGVGCARYPGVYSRISTMHAWISEHVELYGSNLASCGLDDAASPAKAPIKSPTAKSGNECEVSNDTSFRRQDESCLTLMTKNHWEACKILVVKAKCPVSCAFQTLVPLAGKCEDNWNWRWNTVESKDCGWIKKNPDFCRKRSWPDGNQIKFHCPKSCGLCQYSPGTYLPEDNPNYMKDNNIRLKCNNWVARKNTSRLCKSPRIKANCPVTCACF